METLSVLALGLRGLAAWGALEILWASLRGRRWDAGSFIESVHFEASGLQCRMPLYPDLPPGPTPEERDARRRHEEQEQSLLRYLGARITGEPTRGVLEALRPNALGFFWACLGEWVLRDRLPRRLHEALFGSPWADDAPVLDGPRPLVPADALVPVEAPRLRPPAGADATEPRALSWLDAVARAERETLRRLLAGEIPRTAFLRPPSRPPEADPEARREAWPELLPAPRAERWAGEWEGGGPLPSLELPDALLRESSGQLLELGCGLRMRWLAPGSFRMGSPEEEEGRLGSEGPRVDVTLEHGRWLAETPLTRGQHARLLEEARIPALPASALFDRSEREGEDRPCERIEYWRAEALCELLTFVEQESGRLPRTWAFRLPTEAEWEYACRAGTAGPTYGEIDAIAWHQGNAQVVPGGPTGTMPVDTRHRNPWGFADMLGNVSEWCLDPLHETYAGAPTDGRPWIDGGDPARRVLRGGSYRYAPEELRAALRIARAVDAPGNAGIGVRPLLGPRLG